MDEKKNSKKFLENLFLKKSNIFESSADGQFAPTIVNQKIIAKNASIIGIPKCLEVKILSIFQ